MSDWIGELINIAGQVGMKLATKKPPKHDYKWIVQNAKGAGIHPLVALGSNVSWDNPVGSDWGGLGSAIGNGIGSFATDLYNGEMDRRAGAAQDAKDFQQELYDRGTDVQNRERQSRIDKANETQQGLENQLLRLQIANATSRTSDNQARAATVGATTGGNTDPNIPTIKTPIGSLNPTYPNLSNEGQGHYGEGADALATLSLVDDIEKQIAKGQLPTWLGRLLWDKAKQGGAGQWYKGGPSITSMPNFNSRDRDAIPPRYRYKYDRKPRQLF